MPCITTHLPGIFFSFLSWSVCLLETCCCELPLFLLVAKHVSDEKTRTNVIMKKHIDLQTFDHEILRQRGRGSISEGKGPKFDRDKYELARVGKEQVLKV